MNQQPLTVRAFEEPGRFVLALSGELDMAGVPLFEAAASTLCERGCEELVVDISEVGFIDSVGVRAILAVKARCTAHSCEFSMTHGSGQAERIFELTRLLDHLPFRSKRQERFRRELDLWPSAPAPAEEGAES